MKKSEKAAGFLSLAMTVLLAGGCAAKKMDVTEVPQQPAANETAQAPEPTPVPTEDPGEKYTVKNGDTLWAISNQMGIYSDSTEWPLIFKTNRDQIQDPDEINPGQVLMINKSETTDQINHAKQLANDTPAFKPHAEPRNPLPVDYF
jgi:LysM repeat protein